MCHAQPHLCTVHCFCECTGIRQVYQKILKQRHNQVCVSSARLHVDPSPTPASGRHCVVFMKLHLCTSLVDSHTTMHSQLIALQSNNLARQHGCPAVPGIAVSPLILNMQCSTTLSGFSTVELPPGFHPATFVSETQHIVTLHEADTQPMWQDARTTAVTLQNNSNSLQH